MGYTPSAVARYTPSAVARSLVTRRTMTIGLVLPSVSDPFLSQVVLGVEEVALDNGYRVFLCSFYNDPVQERSIVEAFLEHRVDGIVVTSSRLDTAYTALQEQLGIPIVLTNCREYIVLTNCREYTYSVSTDNLHGGRLAVDYLLQLGHTRIGYIATDPQSATSPPIPKSRQIGAAWRDTGRLCKSEASPLTLRSSVWGTEELRAVRGECSSFWL